MALVLERVNSEAIQPYLEETINAQTAMERGKRRCVDPCCGTRATTICCCSRNFPVPERLLREAVPLSVLLPAFVTSELKTAFQIGFLVFIPFPIIDLVVASVLMGGYGHAVADGDLVPFKIMLFVLIDGWTLILGTLARSFTVA